MTDASSSPPGLRWGFLFAVLTLALLLPASHVTGVPAASAVALHPGGGALAAPTVSGSPHRTYGTGIVNGTLVIANDTYRHGNFQSLSVTAPLSPVYDAATGMIYIQDSGQSNISVVDPTLDNMVGDLRGAGGGSSIALDPANGYLYVSNNAAVIVIDPVTDATVGYISIPHLVTALAYDPVDSDIWVTTDYGTGYVEVVSTASNSILATVNVGSGPDSLAVDTNNGNVVVGNYNTNNVSILSGSSFGLLATLSLGTNDYPQAAGFDPQTGQYFVVSAAFGNITVIDGTTNTITTTVVFANSILSPVDLTAVAYDSTNHDMYIADAGDLVVNVMDPSTDTLVTNVSLGNAAEGLTFDPANGDLYTVNGIGGMSVINGATNLVTTWFQTWSWPGAMAFDPATSKLFTANGTMGTILGSGAVVVSDAMTNSITATPAMGFAPWAPAPTYLSPQAIAYDPANGEMYVLADGYDSAIASGYYNLVILDGTTGAIVSSTALPVVAVCLVYDSSNQVMYMGAGAGLTANYLIGYNSANALVSDLPLSATPVALAFDSVDGYIDVLASTGAAADQILVVNPVTNTTINTFNPDPSFMALSHSLTYDPATRYLYGGEANGGLSVVNATTGRLVANVSGVAGVSILDPANGDLYVTDANTNSVGVVSTSSNSMITSIPVGGTPLGITENASGTMIYASNNNAGSISMISLTAPSGAGGGSPLSVSASGTPTSGTAPLTVAFTGTASGGSSPYTYAWNFGDGTATSGAADPQHIYNSSGTFTATLTVTDSATHTGSGAVTVTVSSNGASLSAHGSATPTSGAAPLSVVFSGSAAGGQAPIHYQWNFGDGSAKSGYSGATHVYNTTGTFTATLTVTDTTGATSQAKVTITVNPSGGKGGGNSSSSSGFLGLPGIEGYAVLGAIIAVAAVALGLGLFLKMRKPKVPSSTPPPPAGGAPPPPPYAGATPPPPPPPA